MSLFQFAPSPTSIKFPFLMKPNVFSKEEVDKIIALGDAVQLKKGTVANRNPDSDYSDIRDTQIGWLSESTDTRWLYDKVAENVRYANAQIYNFDLSGFVEDFQYLVYTEGCHYVWHTDDTGIQPAPRKLSVSIQLTDPSEYEGGDLEIMVGGHEPASMSRDLGTMVIFPSYVPHRVTPVTSGIRKALVVWAAGPAFR